jgi:seryl-tRNA synthetase
LSKSPQSRDDALEALDFIVNVLKEHEKDLDKLINELATVTEQIGDTGELSSKVEKVEGKIDSLQKEVANLTVYLSSAPKQTPSVVTPAVPSNESLSVVSVESGKPSVILRCKQWEDFQTLALKAQNLSFCYKEDEKIFQADAIKGNQIITYCGALPKFPSIIKVWLSKQLNVSEANVLEGVLSIS